MSDLVGNPNCLFSHANVHFNFGVHEVNKTCGRGEGEGGGLLSVALEFKDLGNRWHSLNDIYFKSA